jgi:hypothetical protein
MSTMMHDAALASRARPAEADTGVDFGGSPLAADVAASWADGADASPRAPTSLDAVWREHPSTSIVSGRSDKSGRMDEKSRSIRQV